MKYNLVNVDGNALAVISYTSSALKNEGLHNLVSEMQQRAMSGDYNNLLCVCMEYLDIANLKADCGGSDDEYEDDGDDF